MFSVWGIDYLNWDVNLNDVILYEDFDCVDNFYGDYGILVYVWI